MRPSTCKEPKVAASALLAQAERVAAWYIYKGEREGGEEFLSQALALADNDTWFYTDAAGAYLGVEPQP